MYPAKNMHFSLSLVDRNGHKTQFLPMKQKQQLVGVMGWIVALKDVHVHEPTNVALFGMRAFANVIKVRI